MRGLLAFGQNNGQWNDNEEENDNDDSGEDDFETPGPALLALLE